MADPFDLTLPDEWTFSTSDSSVVYEDGESSIRIEIEEFARQLTLYWWVDVYVRTDDGWERHELGLGDSYRSPEAVAADVQYVVDTVVEDTCDRMGDSIPAAFDTD